MNTTTINVLDAALRADPTVSMKQRSAILKVARNGEHPEVEQNGHVASARIYTVKQAAEMLGNRSRTYVHLLASKGLLTRFKARGHQRASGITSASLESFIASNSAAQSTPITA